MTARQRQAPPSLLALVQLRALRTAERLTRADIPTERFRLSPKIPAGGTDIPNMGIHRIDGQHKIEPAAAKNRRKPGAAGTTGSPSFGELTRAALEQPQNGHPGGQEQTNRRGPGDQSTPRR
jgi:hypothetical protein